MEDPFNRKVKTAAVSLCYVERSKHDRKADHWEWAAGEVYLKFMNEPVPKENCNPLRKH